MSLSPWKPTPEQISVSDGIADGRSNVFVPAYAGCAKSSTLELAAPRAPEKHVLGVAFNKKTADELKGRFPQSFEIKTLNGLGHGAWARAIGKRLDLQTNKIGKLVTQVSKDAGLQLTPDEWNGVRSLVTKAMVTGLVPSTSPQAFAIIKDDPANWTALAEDSWIDPAPQVLDLARAVLIESIKLSYQGIVCFDDQIYMSALFGGQFPKFPLVLVDEAQDLSPLNHLQIRKTSSGRLAVVGDPKQAIYAFRGADHQSMTKLAGLRQSWATLPLTTTFRCPQVIVARSRAHAPGFNAAPQAPQGEFINWADRSDPTKWDWSRIEALALATRSALPPTLAVLCRNNAPLLGLAFRLIRQGIGVQMLGRDIGKGLEVLSRKILPDNGTSAPECYSLILQWTESELAKAQAKGEAESKTPAITDRAECLNAVMDSGARDAGDLRAKLAALFNSEGRITLSSVHRAKGLEWDLVLHLDPWRVPSRQAKRLAADGDERALVQELNILYVLETRTKHTLINASLEDFQSPEAA